MRLLVQWCIMSEDKQLTKKDRALVTNPVEDEVPLERVDALIWKYIGLKPVREIADLTGLKPEEILRRKNELLEEVDVLSIQQKRQRLVVELDGMAREARERAASTIDEYYAGMVNASTANIKTLLAELARMEKQDTTRVDALNQKRVQELVSIMRATVDSAVPDIARKFDLDETELFEIFNQRLIEVAQERDLA